MHKSPDQAPTAEHRRLALSELRQENWLRWGPYLSERQWGTVREDYSAGGGGDNPWSYLPHDHARSRAYRWGEDGLLGICDRECRLCFSLALWNGRDPILKERLFGLTGPEGNHGEDVKEQYYYLDSSPTHSYLRALYKYPQARFPYERLAEVNHQRDRNEPEYELLDTGVFDEDRYFDVQAEYAKASPDDILIRITIDNRGPQSAVLHVLPTLWFRNAWVWHSTDERCTTRPSMRLDGDVVRCHHDSLGDYYLCSDCAADGQWSWLFTDNETNRHRHPGVPSESEYFKDAFHEFVVGGNTKAVNPKRRGTKVASYGLMVLPAGGCQTMRLRLTRAEDLPEAARRGGQPDAAMFAAGAFDDFDQLMQDRAGDTDNFYAQIIDPEISPQRRQIMRQAYAGLLWTKQFYHYVVNTWLQGDPAWPSKDPARLAGRNSDWKHLFNRDIISMPDKWEYPWYAAWDSAFHMVPFGRLDIHFAKEQLLLFLREWYMHPNGQIPAYEWQLSDVNPPVHAWAVWQLYKMTGPVGSRDKVFLARCFQKLTVNFTWWVNRKDPRGRNIFAGGFLGLDNIGVFDRSKPLPGGYLEQADGTAWMAFYCGTMLRIALELAEDNPAYGDMASKFFEHYVAIAEAMNRLDGSGLWDEQDHFYYDHLYIDNHSIPMRVRSMVGLIPLLTGVIIDDAVINKLEGFRKRTEWFLANRAGQLSQHMTYMEHEDCTQGACRTTRQLLAIPSQQRFKKLLAVMLDENEFLSPYGIRSLSAVHREQPFVFDFGGQRNEVWYVPGESDSGMFGGNSNWRGPVWFPLNYLLIEALKRYHTFYGDAFQVECPTGSGQMMSLLQVARELERRLISIFEPDEAGRRPAHGESACYADDPHWKDLILFYEYFHADTGRGLGAAHQTGWTALVATLIRSQAMADEEMG